jgi:hypothetical protein
MPVTASAPIEYKSYGTDFKEFVLFKIPLNLGCNSCQISLVAYSVLVWMWPRKILAERWFGQTLHDVGMNPKSFTVCRLHCPCPRLLCLHLCCPRTHNFALLARSNNDEIGEETRAIFGHWYMFGFDVFSTRV